MRGLLFTLLGLATFLSSCVQTSPESSLSPEDHIEIELQAMSWNSLGAVGAARAINPVIAFDNSGHPVVAYQQGRSSPRGYDSSIYVKRWTGSEWVELGTYLDTRFSWSAKSPSIATGEDGSIFVAWYEDTNSASGGFNVYVKQWTGSVWQLVGEALDIDIKQGALVPSLEVDKNNHPVVAWSEYNPASRSSDLYVKRWDGSAWERLGDAVDVEITSTSTFPSLKIDHLNRPTVAWSEDNTISVKRWNGKRWNRFGETLNVDTSERAYAPSLGLARNGRPFVAWHEYDSAAASFKVYTSRWKNRAEGWQRLGGDVNAYEGIESGWQPSLIVDSRNRVRVAWSDWRTRDLYINRWSYKEGAWSGLKTQPIAPMFSASTSLAVDNENTLHTAFTDKDQALVVMKLD